MEEVTVDQMLNLMNNPDTVLITEGKRTIFAGFLGLFKAHNPEYEEVKDKPVKHIGIRTDISHKKWKELGLMSPLEPDKLQEYSFSDLQMTVYRLIEI